MVCGSVAKGTISTRLRKSTHQIPAKEGQVLILGIQVEWIVLERKACVKINDLPRRLHGDGSLVLIRIKTGNY